MRRVGWALCALLALCFLAGGAIVLALPRAREPSDSPPGAGEADPERAALLEQLRPPKRARPLIAVIANNGGTETTDFIVPYGVLRASGAADVFAVALRDEPVTMMPALRIRPQLDVAKFDAAHPEGADFVIVPAMHQPDEPQLAAWLAAQAKSGATIAGICDGAWVLGAAGLLDGRTATSHWFSVGRLRKAFPSMTWAEDRRYVVDRKVATTTGVSASIPFSLTLVEAIAGRARAEELAHDYGVASFGASHSSRAFQLDRAALWTAARNTLAFWSHDRLDVSVTPGVDEVALALTADAYARTYRSSVRSVSLAPEVVSRNGLTILPDAAAEARGAKAIALPADGASAIDAALAGISDRYGPATADFVALQLEYDRPVQEVRP
jgi:transcriptional regulator GlxA family with amidase domain